MPYTITCYYFQLHVVSKVTLAMIVNNSLKTANLTIFSVFWCYNSLHNDTHCKGTQHDKNVTQGINDSQHNT